MRPRKEVPGFDQDERLLLGPVFKDETGGSPGRVISNVASKLSEPVMRLLPLGVKSRDCGLIYASVVGLTRGYEATSWLVNAELSRIGWSVAVERTKAVEGSCKSKFG